MRSRAGASRSWGFSVHFHGAKAEALGLDLDDRGNVLADTYATSEAGVFAAGDARVGASLVVTAIDEGRKCAEAVHTYLSSVAPDRAVAPAT